MPRFENLTPDELERIKTFVEETDIEAIDDEMRALVEKHWPWLVEKLPPAASGFSREAQAKRLYGLGEIKAETLEVLRLMVRQTETERGENLDADLVERAKQIVERYDHAMMKGHEAPGVIPFRRD